MSDIENQLKELTERFKNLKDANDILKFQLNMFTDPELLMHDYLDTPTHVLIGELKFLRKKIQWYDTQNNKIIKQLKRQ